MLHRANRNLSSPLVYRQIRELFYISPSVLVGMFQHLQADALLTCCAATARYKPRGDQLACALRSRTLTVLSSAVTAAGLPLVCVRRQRPGSATWDCGQGA